MVKQGIALSEVSLAATPETFLAWGQAGQELLDRVSRASNTPHEQRILREFRRTEAIEVGGITEHRWNKERQGNDGAQVRVTLEEIHAMQDKAGIRPRRPEGSKPIRLAVSNFKGGASKTTVALHLSHYLAFRGYRVLVIDSDPQGTLSRMFGFLPESIDRDRTLASVFFPEDESTLRPIKTHIDGLDMIPASLHMIGADIQVAVAFQRQDAEARNFYRLVDNALSKIDDDYDIVVIDTAPAFSFAAVNILWAANALLCPLPPVMSDFSASIDFNRMVGDVLGEIVALVGGTKVWNPTVVMHSRGDSSTNAEGIRAFASSIWGINRCNEFLPESKAYQAASSRLRSVYEMTAAELDSRSLGRARSAADRFGAQMVQYFNQAWAEQLAGGES